MPQLAPLAKQQFFDSNGNPLSSGKLYTYITATSTPKSTYSDNASPPTANANPIILDSRGECSIWLDADAPYRFTLKDSADVTIWTKDDVTTTLNGTPVTVATIAALKALTGGAYPTAQVMGYYAAADGGGGLFRWNSADTSSDNGGTIIAPNSGTGRWNRVYENPLNVRWFGAKGDGVTDDTASIQAAVTAMFANRVGVYYPAGSYLMSSTITMGNNATDCGRHIHFIGDGDNSIIKVTAASKNPFLITGPTPDTDGAGNRFTGRTLIEKLFFAGPGYYGGTKSGTGIKFYGAQGITLRDVFVQGWDTGEYYQNVDIVMRDEVWSQNNNKGVDSTATGYALTGAGQMNSFKCIGGQVGNNSTHGISYFGGIAPVFEGVNFTVNGKSLILSSTGGSTSVTTSPSILGCYFELDTSDTITLGGGSGIVRDPVIEGGHMIITAGQTGVKVANASNNAARARINIAMSSSGGYTDVDQASSAGKIDVYDQTGLKINPVMASAAVANGWGMDFAAKAANAIANAGTLNLAIGSGLVMLHDNTSGNMGVFIAYAGTVAKVAGAADMVAGAAGANQIGLAWTGAVYQISNGYGVSHDVYVALLKTRPTS